MIVVYGVYYSNDDVEGRTPPVLKQICSTQKLAERYALNKGPMGMSDGEVRKLYVLENDSDAIEASNAVEIDAALKKLTPRERLLLKVGESQ